MATTYTDTKLPSIKLETTTTPLRGVPALALVQPADGVARPVTAADFPVVPAVVKPARPAAGNGRATGIVTRNGVVPKSMLAIARKPGVTMEGRKTPPRAAAAAPGAAAPVGDAQIFNHPDVGGKFTIFVLFYGPEKWYDLHRRCLGSIISTVPHGRMDLRVGSNELNPRSLAMINDYVSQGLISKHYYHADNRTKYPVMREMFHDPTHPIATKWVLWFDDDSVADKAANWLSLLSHAIIQHHRKDNAHMFGSKFVWTLQPGQREWYESRPWFKGRPWRGQNGKPAPNGNKIIFCPGGFWALTHEAIQACNIPDPGLGHNGGDVLCGEALWQNGFDIKAFNSKKQFVNTSSVPRRGISQPHPGTHR